MVNTPLIRPYFWEGYVKGGVLVDQSEIYHLNIACRYRPCLGSGMFVDFVEGTDKEKQHSNRLRISGY